MTPLRALVLFVWCGVAAGFAPRSSCRWAPRAAPIVGAPASPASLAPTTATAAPRARSLTARPGVFGLGAPEIAVIVVAAGFILGPDQLSVIAKDMGKVAGELKDVPKEFSAGLAEAQPPAEPELIAEAKEKAPADESPKA
jgi:sec-independent protein translocase protein TatA